MEQTSWHGVGFSDFDQKCLENGWWHIGYAKLRSHFLVVYMLPNGQVVTVTVTPPDWGDKVASPWGEVTKADGKM